jgi:ParB/RepB/Spo0J family partition protein
MKLEELVLLPTNKWYGEIVDLPIDLIKPDPHNLREDFDEDDLTDLGKNIQTIGQLDEITVFPVLLDENKWMGYFDLHDGERRWRAAKLVGIKTLKAKIIHRPSNEELLYKKVSRVLQTRSLSPEKKAEGLERALAELNILDKHELWESYRKQLGGGQDWPQLIRVISLRPEVRDFLNKGLINFTVAQSVGRLPIERQLEIAQYVVVNKINGRFFSTQMVPYLLENPDSSPAQAFEHARVGGWRQYSQSPYQKGQEPPTSEKVDNFLEACVKWERAWEIIVQTGLVFEIKDDNNLEYRLVDAARRIQERAKILNEKIAEQRNNPSETIILPSPIMKLTRPTDKLDST